MKKFEFGGNKIDVTFPKFWKLRNYREEFIFTPRNTDFEEMDNFHKLS